MEFFDSKGENGKKAGLEAYNGTFGSLFITFFLEMLKEEKPLSLSHNLYVCIYCGCELVLTTSMCHVTVPSLQTYILDKNKNFLVA